MPEDKQRPLQTLLGVVFLLWQDNNIIWKMNETDSDQHRSFCNVHLFNLHLKSLRTQMSISNPQSKDIPSQIIPLEQRPLDKKKKWDKREKKAFRSCWLRLWNTKILHVKEEGRQAHQKYGPGALVLCVWSERAEFFYHLQLPGSSAVQLGLVVGRKSVHSFLWRLETVAHEQRCSRGRPFQYRITSLEPRQVMSTAGRQGLTAVGFKTTPTQDRTVGISENSISHCERLPFPLRRKTATNNEDSLHTACRDVGFERGKRWRCF